MPIQLPVILSQSSQAHVAHREFDETLVARLMLDEGADVRLLDPIENIQQASTDLLMLEGLGGDFALLVWSTPEDAIGQLRRHGIEGRRAAHESDPNPPSEVGRRIYVVDLNNHSKIDSVISVLKKASLDRSTKTLQIGVAGLSQTAKPEKSISAISKVKSKSQALPTVATGSHEGDAEEDLNDAMDDQLESLVDDLDQLDL